MAGSVGQLVIGIAGGVAGFLLTGGNPLGAAVGFSLGAGLGSLAFPQKIDGPSIPPTLMQRSNYGVTLPIGFGCFRCAGTVIWEGGISSHTSSSSAGKGGPQVTTTTYAATFACAICDCSFTGPITGIRRVWMNGQLVYDVSGSADAATLTASAKFAEGMVVYTGTSTQGVDPTMQAVLGVGNCPAYRDTAYVVFIDLPLTPYGNTIPVANFEVVNSGAAVIAKAWENDTLAESFGGPQTNGQSGIFPIITQISPQIRVANRNPWGGSPGYGGDGNVYLFDPNTGAAQGTTSQTGGEAAIYSGYLDPGGAIGSSGSTLCMIDPGGNFAIFAAQGVMPAGHASGLGGGNMSIYVTTPSAGAILYDALPVVALPVGTSVQATAAMILPCADSQHVLVLLSAYDSTAAADFYALSVVSVSGSAAPALASSKTWSVPHGSGSGNLWNQWFSTASSGNLAFGMCYYHDLHGMLESTLDRVWITGTSGGTSFPNGFLCIDLTQTPPVQILASGQTPNTETGPALTTGSQGGAMFADNGTCVLVTGTEIAMWTAGGLANITETSLDLICKGLAEAVGVPSTNIDVARVSGVPVWGCLIERQTTLRDVMNALAPTFWFDMVESDQKLSFRQRSATAVATISVDDMVVDDKGKKAGDPLLITRADDTSLPFRVDVGYYSVGADYQTGAQYATRLTTQSTNRVSVNAAAVMSDQEAANAAAVILWDAWAGRLQFEFSTGMKWGQVEPTDIVNLLNGANAYLARITEKKENGITIEWKAIGCAPVYNQNIAPGIIAPWQQSIYYVGDTTLVLLDLPPLRDADGNAGAPLLYVAMMGGTTAWPGGILFKSIDGGATWVQQITNTLSGGIGVTTTALAAWPGGNFFDECSAVTVDVRTPGGSLSSASEAAVLAGANLCLIGNELLQFKHATLTSGTTYVLTGLLRGRLDTEVEAATAHSIGEQFVQLSFANGASAHLNIEPESVADIGVVRDYQTVTSGQALNSAPVAPFTSTGANLVCFRPCYLFAAKAPGSTDIAIQWMRRNRITWQWVNNIDVPMSESPSNANGDFVVSIFNGSAVVRTISVTNALTCAYTTAQQTADFGGAQTTLKFGVQQVSAITGPGKMAILTTPIV